MKFIVGMIAGVVIVCALVLVYLVSGFAPVAATDKPMPLETWIAGTALQKRMQKDAPTRDLSTMTDADLLVGADTYKKDCAVCHGLPDQATADIGDGMFPPAPQLMRTPPPRPGRAGEPARRGGPPPGFAAAQMGTVKGRGASGDFWRVKNGIRLTGMPSFEKTLSDDQMWQVVYLLSKRRNLPPDVKAALESQAVPPAAPSAVPDPAEGKKSEHAGRG
ncbi:MAG TPA: cytochrome c [Candidatus Aquilonibacter sp.]|nr:cytochrome c [Candidatus Aquilonibacter sp.]